MTVLLEKPRHTGDDTPVIGGTGFPARLRMAAPEIADAVGDELILHIARLRVFHPELPAGLVNQDLGALDRRSQERLLDEINRHLGISHLRDAEQPRDLASVLGRIGEIAEAAAEPSGLAEQTRPFPPDGVSTGGDLKDRFIAGVTVGAAVLAAAVVFAAVFDVAGSVIREWLLGENNGGSRPQQKGDDTEPPPAEARP